jgi:glycosyltransferase involved in cell wall biosynthesis
MTASSLNKIQSPVQISVALVTRNRPDSLERTLKSLRAQCVQPWEVIVSDDSGDDHRAATEQMARQYDCRYIRGPQRGLYANRNHVALACCGSHIRTMDDDHEFLPEHFACCQRAVEQDPDSVWIIGEYMPCDERPGVMPIPPGQLTARGVSLAPPDPDNCWAISDGGTIYPRRIFDSGLRFAEEYKFGNTYLEFGSRLYWLGYRMRYLQGTYFIHHYIAGGRSFANEEMEQASRFFAGLCHSCLYQPSARNKILISLQILKQLAVRPKLASRALHSGLRGYRKQRDWLKQQDLAPLRAGPPCKQSHRVSAR